MKYMTIKTGDIPGVEVREDGAYAELAGQWFPVVAVKAVAGVGLVPILDIPQMSDERWDELAKEHPLPKGVTV